MPFTEVEEPLRKLLQEFGPSRKSYHPEYPFWWLQNDGLWEVPEGQTLQTRKQSSNPTLTEMRRASGGFPDNIQQTLQKRPYLVQQLIQNLLTNHFPETYHEALLAAVGLSLETSSLEESQLREQTRLIRPRDPAFRQRVLAAYGYQCAVCDLSPLLDGAVVLMEAAHVWWHSHGGPATEANGLCLCPLHHRALDFGLIGISEDHRLVVSRRLREDEPARMAFHRFHGKPLRTPVHPTHRLAHAHILWHQGQVFKAPSREV
jgi:putative restriction endonuclease